MYKITVFFKSNVEGVYTKEEETAIDKWNAEFQYDKMLKKWFEILCPHIDLKVYLNHNDIILRMRKYTKLTNFRHQKMIELIDQALDDMDAIDEELTGIETTIETQRLFEIKVEEI